MSIFSRRARLALSLFALSCGEKPVSAPGPKKSAASETATTQAPAAAPQDDARSRIDEICAAVSKLEPPRATAPVSGTSEEHYYGIKTPVDFDKAYQAALLEYQKNRNGLAFGDSTILMMLYANGYGVAKNLDLAIKFACEIDSAPAERESRVLHLRALKQEQKHGRFDVCDDVTSSQMEGFCLSREGEIKAQQQTRRVEKLAASMTPEQERALQKLRAAAAVFQKSVVQNEVDQSAMGASSQLTYVENEQRDSFSAALAKFEGGELPHYTAEERSAADAELNGNYRALMSADFGSSTIQPNGVRATEKKWLIYRNALTEYGVARFPSTTREDWETWATKQRALQLDDLRNSL